MLSPPPGPDVRSGTNTVDASEARSAVLRQGLLTYGVIIVQTALSTGLTCLNKYILYERGFHFPIGLTCFHMVFLSTVTFIICRVLRLMPTLNMSPNDYFRIIAPLAALNACALASANCAYLYITVAFAQMARAGSPVAVYFCMMMFGMANFSWKMLSVMVWISCGVAVASLGEIQFSAHGFVLIISTVIFDSLRLVALDKLLHKRGYKLNPITTLYYVAPISIVFLVPLSLLFEIRPLIVEGTLWQNHLTLSAWWLLFSAVLAFALQGSFVMMVNRTSALTANIAGKMKNICIIVVSTLLFHTTITTINIIGYSIAMAGVACYNYMKYLEVQSKQARALLDKSNSETKLKQETQDELEIDPNFALSHFCTPQSKLKQQTPVHSQFILYL